MDSFDDKTALITGGATGIGKATALALAAKGAFVVIAGRRENVGLETVQLIRGRGGHAEFVSTDVTDIDALSSLHEHVIQHRGSIDIAFNNAGFQEKRAPLIEQEDETYARVFDTNVRAVFHCLRLQIREMTRSGGGAIIVNASVSGLRNPNAGFSLYSASKAAAISLTKSAAMEAAEHGVRINLVAPGRVQTDMMLSSNLMDMKQVAAGLPIRRMGNPEEVAQAVLWLASEKASFVVGHVLCVDGGFMTL